MSSAQSQSTASVDGNRIGDVISGGGKNESVLIIAGIIGAVLFLWFVFKPKGKA